MGDIVIAKLQELERLDKNTHWFCPCTGDDDGPYFDEDVLTILDSETESHRYVRHQKIKESEVRRDTALEASKILAFDGADAKPYQEQFEKDLRIQMTRCDVCVRQYHRSRSLLRERLETEFEDDEVSQFMDKFDMMNISRISAGLKEMTENLQDLPPDQRSIASAGNTGMYALFEALNCIPFLKDEELLQQKFDHPFRLVQSRKKLKLPNYAPGMAAFMFSYGEERAAWASRNFSQIKRPFSGSEFQYGVKPFWEAAMGRVNITNLEVNFLPVFWNASRTIIDKLVKDIVSTHVRTMETNLYTLGLEHFQIDGSHISDLLGSYQKLLDIDHDVFWDAFGNIGVQAIFETVLRAPVLQHMFRTSTETGLFQLEERLDFPVQFIKTMKPHNMVPPTRVILDTLLHQLQNDTYSRYARRICFEKGIACMLESLKAMNTYVGGGPIAAHMLQLVSTDHIALVMQELDVIEEKAEIQVSPVEQMCLGVVQNALALEVSGLAFDRNSITKANTANYEINVSSLNIWKMSMQRLKPGHIALPSAILAGVTGLLSIENFGDREIQIAPKITKDWNDALQRMHSCVCDDLLGRLDSFSPDQLIELLQDPDGSHGLIALLFNGNPMVHNSALNVLKVLSGEDNRRDSLMHVVRAFTPIAFQTTNRALGVITAKRVFGSSRIALKLCTDIFSCITATQDGLLRSRGLSENDAKGLGRYWEKTWQLLGMIFEQTEPWASQLGYDKQVMHDFCRETMDFADNAFDQYSILASCLQDISHRPGEELRKELLEHPKTQFGHICKWLRLRDEYLISKAVGLASKILGRLKEVDIKIDNQAAQYVEDVVTSSEQHARIKTRLSMSQKAELQSALEKHLGETLQDVIEIGSQPVSKKQTSLQAWASSGQNSGSQKHSGSGGKPKQGAITVDAWSSASKRNKQDHFDADAEFKKLLGGMNAAERHKMRLQQRQQQKKSAISAPTRAVQRPQPDQQGFLAKRQKEKEEAEKRRAMALAKAKGVPFDSTVDLSKLKGENVMVSSDEEESDDDDEEDVDSDLFGPSNKERKKTQGPTFDPNGAIGLKPEQKRGPVRIQRTARSAKDMRARLAPDLAPLHRVILKWDYFHDGDYPPGANEHQFREVASSFTDPVTYQQTFEPLLTLEAWQNLVKNREENSSKPYSIKIQSRSNVDAFIELSSSITNAENKELSLSEGDIILFSKAKNPSERKEEPHCLARIYRVKRQKAHCEVVYQVMAGTSLAPSLIQQATVQGLKVQSITPLEREYGSLKALQYYDLCPQIAKAQPSRRTKFSDNQIANYQDVWNVNRAQSEAINAALENEGFSLIQGPPGSGKTKTIVAIVGGLLSHTLSSSSSAARISLPKANGNSSTGADSMPKKLMVCAPSNAAVDELVMRFKEGVISKSGRRYNLNVVRIGRSEAINSQVVDVTMEELVSKRLGTSENEKKTREKNAELFKEHEKVSANLRDLYKRRDGGEANGKGLIDLENEIVAVRKRKNELGVRIDMAKDAERNAGREAELNRKKAQQAVLDEAHVICATLSGSGHDMFQSLNIEFETVIIDEAAQCVEMSSLIPLKYGCVKCIMVGDPKQLPPTVFSKEAARFSYEQSLFVRMQNNYPDEVHLLDTQYRMHPDISVFPSRSFYDGLLKDGQGMAGLRQRPWHASALLSPYRFFDVAGQHQAAPKGHSLINLAEIEVAIALYERLTTDFTEYDFTGRIGIITPYKSQLRALKDRFSSRFGNRVFETIEFNTTDAFQGRESEVIIFSCVRASPAGGIGFLQDIRRMNVGLTRAKSSLWVLGNSESLMRGEWWKKLVQDSQARERYTTGNLISMLKKSSSSFPVAYDAKNDVLSSNNNSHSKFTNGTREVHMAEIDVTERDQPSRSASHTPNPVQDTDRMEGVRYRYEDRIASRKTGAAGVNSRTQDQIGAEGRGPKPPDSGDIDMADADDAVDNLRTPIIERSNDRTNKEFGQSDVASDTKQDSMTSSKPKIPFVAPPHQPRLNKRPSASPFLPRKQQKPK